MDPSMLERSPEMERSEAFDDDTHKYLNCLKAAVALHGMAEDMWNSGNYCSCSTCIAFCHVSKAFHIVL